MSSILFLLKNFIYLPLMISGFLAAVFKTLQAEVKENSLKRTQKRMIKNNQPVGNVTLIVDKSEYELNVYDDLGWYATYPVVFGNSSLEDKKMQGDRNTPEGVYYITSKRIHSKWCRFLLLDYPNAEDVELFQLRKRKGEIPKHARIGGGIGIHGTWPNEDYVVDNYINWTLGCISMKNEDVKELYRFVNPGVKVIIRK
ncbi:MAG: L,D-transpeptidase [Chitinophagaceae bacterium]|nr:L,D-transpeptidase [Chitinophagaceae bacterium]